MIFCVTGPMAAGKNVASEILVKEHGFVSTDLDVMVHDVIRLVEDDIFDVFMPYAKLKGIELKNSDGSLNRRALGALIFSNKELVKKQESIVYPALNVMINEFLEKNKGKNIILNATVLFKIDAIHLCDKVLYIDAPLFYRLIRALKRDKMPLKHILSRFNAQKALFSQYTESGADIYRIWNTGTYEKLAVKIADFLQQCQ